MKNIMTPAVSASNSNNTKEYQGCSFYFIYRQNNGQWCCNLSRPFILCVSETMLTGQYISSMWFNLEFNENDTFDFIVIRLPQREHTIHPDSQITKHLLTERLIDAEQANTPLGELDFVVLHKHYISQELCAIQENLQSLKTKNNISGSYHDCKKLTNDLQFGLTFKISERNTLTSNTTSKAKSTDKCIDKPATIIRGYGSLNNKVHEKTESDKYYVSCPLFQLRI